MYRREGRDYRYEPKLNRKAWAETSPSRDKETQRHINATVQKAVQNYLYYTAKEYYVWLTSITGGVHSHELDNIFDTWRFLWS